MSAPLNEQQFTDPRHFTDLTAEERVEAVSHAARVGLERGKGRPMPTLESMQARLDALRGK